MTKKPVQRPSVGDIVRIEFWDHAEGDEAMCFEVFGRLYKITRWAYSLRCWGYVSDVDRAGDSRSDNETDYTIVKKAVESIKVLK
jgi:hypothetical protein